MPALLPVERSSSLVSGKDVSIDCCVKLESGALMVCVFTVEVCDPILGQRGDKHSVYVSAPETGTVEVISPDAKILAVVAQPASIVEIPMTDAVVSPDALVVIDVDPIAFEAGAIGESVSSTDLL